MRRVFALVALALIVSAAAIAAILVSGHDASATEDITAAAAQEPRSSTVARRSAMPVAVELFTSQGCSSCPPADALIASLVDDPDLVIITRPVTYWDRLGWRDTLGREENTELQRRYARTLIRGGGRAYTPQAVVNGRIGLVGSRRAELRQAIADTGRRRGSVRIASTRAANGGRAITVRGNADETAQVRLLALDSHETVSIGRGENRGRTVEYTNVLRSEHTLGAWSGGTGRFQISASDLDTPEADRHAIVVRQGAGGPILAVRYL